jgi:hypothetical protein
MEIKDKSAAGISLLVLALMLSLVVYNASKPTSTMMPFLQQQRIDAVSLPFAPCQRSGPSTQLMPALFTSPNYMTSATPLIIITIMQKADFFDGCSGNKCVIVDMGAGMMMFKAALKNMSLYERVLYLPIDYVARFDTTIVCDFNALQFPFEQIPKDYERVAFIFSNSFEYIVNKPAILLAATQFKQSIVILAYHFGTARTSRAVKWVAPLTRFDLAMLCVPLNLQLHLSFQLGKSCNGSVILDAESVLDLCERSSFALVSPLKDPFLKSRDVSFTVPVDALNKSIMFRRIDRINVST